MKHCFAWVVALLTTVAPAIVFGHPGHGVEGSVAHDLAHAVWSASAVGLFFLVVCVYRSYRERKQTERKYRK